MCWMCDHPGSTLTEYHEYLIQDVGRYDWIVQYVEPDRIHPPWAYTVGLTVDGVPEVVITGMRAAQVGPLLNAEVQRFLDHGFPETGDRFTLTNGWTAEVVVLAHPRAHLNTADALFGDRPMEAIQLVWCDDRGHWPWEPGFRGWRGGQPMLGPRST